MSAIQSKNSASKSAALRARLKHPIVDADGHTVEFEPGVLDYLKDIAGSAAVERYKSSPDGAFIFPWNRMTEQERLDWREFKPVWWGHPMKNTLDRATSTLPKLLHSRMDEFGLDFAIIYPSLGMFATELADAELRQAVCRAYNKYHADIFREYGDRLAPVAVIPMHTPQEAIAELEYAVKELGMKAVMLPTSTRRPIPALEHKYAEIKDRLYWLDNHCVDSIYNYDPVWAKCVELKVAPTFHSVCLGMSSRTAPSNFVFNHLGHFAEAGQTAARALFMGGVTRRFPQLRFAFLEGGVAWGCELYNDIFMDWRTRNVNFLPALDPANLDEKLFADLCASYGGKFFTDRLHRMKEGTDASDLIAGPRDAGRGQDEFERCGIAKESDIRDLFAPSFFFGCEGEDHSVGYAFDARKNPHNARLNAMFGSDIGHFDVPEMNEAVSEAYGLVEKGVIEEADFRDFVFTNPVKLHAEVNPEFFKGTAIETEVARLLADSSKTGPMKRAA
jgi:predicted TIM-barrel fold metal-dependent hydrolase